MSTTAEENPSLMKTSPGGEDTQYPAATGVGKPPAKQDGQFAGATTTATRNEEDSSSGGQDGETAEDDVTKIAENRTEQGEGANEVGA